MDLADFDGFGEGDAFGDENDQENGPPAVANAAARADSSGELSGSDENEPLEERKERKKMGRPPLPDLPLDEIPKGECVLSLGVLISRVMVAMSRGNVAVRTQQSIWDAFSAGFTHLPNFRHAKVLLARQASLQSKEHACCPNDCYVHRPALADITGAERHALRCPICDQQLVTKHGHAKKVIAQAHFAQFVDMEALHKLWTRAHCRFFFCSLSFDQVYVAISLHRHRTTTAETS